MYQILMVDDETDIDILTVQKFRYEIKNGLYRFHFARHGVEALEVLNTNSDIAIVITDINMPLMNGFELLEKIQQLPIKPKTVIVSAYGDSDILNRIEKSGVSGFINKPINYAELKQTIESLLN